MRILAPTMLTLALLAVMQPARADDFVVTPVVRVAIGPSIHVAPAADRSNQIALDATAGFSGLFTRDVKGFGIDPELGYTYDGIGLNAFNLTCGVGYGHLLGAFAYHPRLIVGTDKGMVAVGMRNGIMAHLVADMASIEIGHQFVSYGGALHQSIQILFGVNPAGMIYTLAGLR